MGNKEITEMIQESERKEANKEKLTVYIVIFYESGINDLEIYEYILNYMIANCDYKIDIMHLESITESDEELNKFALSQGLTAIEESTHENLLKEVI